MRGAIKRSILLAMNAAPDQRAEAAQDVRAMARSPQPTGSTNSRCTQELEAQTNLLLAAKSEHEEYARPLALTAPQLTDRPSVNRQANRAGQGDEGR